MRTEGPTARPAWVVLLLTAVACTPFPETPYSEDARRASPAASRALTSEPKSRYGNPPFYEVHGKRYYVMDSAAGYVERGIASWYGPKFHGRRTSNGERYDMHGMSAAHKSLPLPTWVEVTNLDNGRSVVVRVNDRGPFKDGRIIDMSYGAAQALDMVGSGTALVEVRALDSRTADAGPSVPATGADPDPGPGDSAEPDPAPVAPPTTGPGAESAPGSTEGSTEGSAGAGALERLAGAGPDLYLQVGAFGERANAERLQDRLAGLDGVSVRAEAVELDGRRLWRVQIGPIPSVERFDRLVEALRERGIADMHLSIK